MGMLGRRFPAAQFVITGVLGPESNAHGPNEFLHLPTARRVTAATANILDAHARRPRADGGGPAGPERSWPPANHGRSPAERPATRADRDRTTTGGPGREVRRSTPRRGYARRCTMEGPERQTGVSRSAARGQPFSAGRPDAVTGGARRLCATPTLGLPPGPGQGTVSRLTPASDTPSAICLPPDCRLLRPSLRGGSPSLVSSARAAVVDVEHLARRETPGQGHFRIPRSIPRLSPVIPRFHGVPHNDATGHPQGDAASPGHSGRVTRAARAPASSGRAAAGCTACPWGGAGARPRRRSSGAPCSPPAARGRRPGARPRARPRPRPGSSSTAAFTCSPHSSSGMPNTATSATADARPARARSRPGRC